MRKLFLVILFLIAVAVPWYLFQPSISKSLQELKKRERPKPVHRSRKKTKEPDTLDSLLNDLLAAAKKNTKTQTGKKTSRKNTPTESPGPVTQFKTALQTLMEQLQTDENGKLLLELFQGPATETPTKRGK